MYCDNCKNIIRCNSIQVSKCKECNKELVTFNAPPLDTICKECSIKLKKCELCGKEKE